MADNDKSGPSIRAVPPGDDRERLVCPDCGYVAYENPRVIVAAVCVWEEKFLMCRRAIQPRKGFWTIPAGYLEMGETTAEGAAREAWEEAKARIAIEGLIGIYEIPRISQVYVVHKARLLAPEFAAGPESDEVALMDWRDIPWDAIAFPSIHWALERFRQGLGPGLALAPEAGPGRR